MRAAIAFLEIFFARMILASCQAMTRLSATASTSSKMPSSLSRRSSVDPLWFGFLGLRLCFAMPLFYGAGLRSSLP